MSDPLSQTTSLNETACVQEVEALFTFYSATLDLAHVFAHQPQEPIPQPLHEALIKAAFFAKSHSYSPYSKFQVGAALLSRSGRVWLGCNVENASYGGAICAERTAFVNAVSSGDRGPFLAIYLASSPLQKQELTLVAGNANVKGEGSEEMEAEVRESKGPITTLGRGPYISPCGICRQFMAEFGTSLAVIMLNERGDGARRCCLAQLLPFSFGPEDLLDGTA